MNWEMIGAVGELLGAIVVVGSIIYLSSEVRHNTAVARVDAKRNVATSWANWNLTVCTDDLLPRLWAKTLYEDVPRSELEADEAIRVSFSYLAILRLMESGYRSWQEGIVTEEESWAGAQRDSAIWDVQFVAESWPLWKRELPSDFTDYLEASIPQLRDS